VAIDRRFRYLPILVAFLVVAWIPVLNAQVFRGSIVGNVTDPSDAVITNIQISAVSQATGAHYASSTSSAGQYQFQDLPLGNYTLSVTTAGFKQVAVKNIKVEAGSAYVLNLKLQLANGDETIEVSAAAISLDTETAAQTTNLSATAIEDLPIAGRSFIATEALVPGFAGYSNNSLTGAINGTRVQQVNYQINGTDNNDPFRNQATANQNGQSGISGVLFPIDAIEEFSLQTVGSAETGRNPGGTLNLVTKSGTNDLHGSAFYFNRNEALAAASPFLPEDNKKPANRSTNWGGSLGGPIKRNRTFFFFSYEKQTFSISPGSYGTEPGTGYQADARRLLKQYSVAENSAATTALNTLWPSAALTAASSDSASNYFAPDPEYGYSHNFFIKVDQKINDNNSLSASWYAGEGQQVVPVSTYLKWYYDAGPMHVQNYSVIWNSILSPRLTNQLQLGSDSTNQKSRDFKHDQDVQQYYDTESPFAGSPAIEIGNFDTIGPNGIGGRVDVTGHVTDALSWDIGHHSIRLGGEFRHAQANEFYYNNALGTLIFNGESGPWSADTSISTNTAALADFLAGYSSSSSISYGTATRNLYYNSGAFFAHDNWHLNQHLTLNFGVRYEYTTPVHNGDKNLSTFIPSRGVVFLGNGLDSLYPRDYLNIAPRVGFSYQPSEKSGIVVRGGFGIYYDTPAFDIFVQANSPNSGASGIQANPGGQDPVNTYAQNATTIVAGQPIFANAILDNSTSEFAVSQRFKTPRDYTYHLQVEQSIGDKAIVQLGYVGLQGRHLTDMVDINPAALNSTGTVVDSTRPYYAQFPNVTAINQLGTDATSNYNSLQAVLKTSNWHGLSGQLAYTWSHNLDNDSAPQNNDAASYSNTDWPQNNLDLKANYGNADTDERHSLTAELSYVVPQLAALPGWLSGGWSLDSAISVRSGNPFTIVAGNLDTTGTGDYSQFVNIVGNPTAGISHKIVNNQVQWFNTNAFSLPTAGTYGNERRNQLVGPGYSDVDLSVFKSVNFTERIKGQFRAELFNVFNRTNLGFPSIDYSTEANGFGTISSTVGASEEAPGIGPGEPFNVQLGLRLTF